MMLDRDVIFRPVAHLGCREGLIGRTAPLWRGVRVLGRVCRALQGEDRIT